MAAWLILAGIMCAPASNSFRAWNGLLLIAEAVALLGCVYGLTYCFSYRYYAHNGISWNGRNISVLLMKFGEPWLREMFWSFLGALLILMIVSPFLMFSSSLRRAAFKAWIIGALSLLCVGFALYYAN
jgi:hypothetical protein